MKQFILGTMFSLGLLLSQNNYPIVLIHGFMGWGESEMGGYHYWGGHNDFVQSLKDNGHIVFELSVGPVSSNWERAIEAYYQLKGGQVNYGKVHSNKYGIIQKPVGKLYEGLYPEWGNNNPVHIIGHSMGGQTARMLQYLLSQEFYIDKEALKKEESELLGMVQNDLIRSITAISTPHNGTTLTDIVNKTIPFIQYFVGIAGVLGTHFFDFDLQQWNFFRGENETWSNYLTRMRNHNLWDTKNISSWELSLDGAKELNSYLEISPDIYYFSLATSTTEKNEFSQNHDPVKGTSILIKTRSKLLSAREGYWADGSSTDSSWFENDGVVNTISMYGPSTGTNGPDPIVEYEKTDLLIPGQWYWQKILEMDHWSIVGHFGNEDRIYRAEKYLIDQVDILKNLPKK